MGGEKIVEEGFQKSILDAGEALRASLKPSVDKQRHQRVLTRPTRRWDLKNTTGIGMPPTPAVCQRKCIIILQLSVCQFFSMSIYKYIDI